MDDILIKAGGARAHPDADRRQKPGADYLLHDAVIELKALDDEGMSKPERQRKIAELFHRYGDNRRSVVVVDRSRLPETGRREFDRIMDRPINGIVKKARSQLLQSRSELGQAKTSILMVLNNGYTALGHDALVELVANRARQDTREIDGIVVGGCYHYGDGFDSVFFWPLTYIPINANAPFRSFPALKQAWDAYAERAMTALIRGELPMDTGKGPVVDIQFEVDGITYVKPAPPMGAESDFYARGRPRHGVDGKNIPPVAITFPDMTESEWRKFREVLPSEFLLGRNYGQWKKNREEGFEASMPTKPFVPMQVTRKQWAQWCKENRQPKNGRSVREYANTLFSERMRELLRTAKERRSDSILPARYVLVITEEIGQDRGNDLTRIGVVQAETTGEFVVKELLLDARIFHEYGLALACAYAVAEGIDCVLWQKDSRYAWH